MVPRSAARNVMRAPAHLHAPGTLTWLVPAGRGDEPVLSLWERSASAASRVRGGGSLRAWFPGARRETSCATGDLARAGHPHLARPRGGRGRAGPLPLGEVGERSEPGEGRRKSAGAVLPERCAKRHAPPAHLHAPGTLTWLVPAGGGDEPVLSLWERSASAASRVRGGGSLRAWCPGALRETSCATGDFARAGHPHLARPRRGAGTSRSSPSGRGRRAQRAG